MANLSKQASILLILLIAGAGTAKASGADYELPVLHDSISARFDKLHIYYNDRVAPLQTMTRDYSLKAYGKRLVERSPVQTQEQGPRHPGGDRERVHTHAGRIGQGFQDIPLKD